ncbi:MAG: ATP-binding protein [Clostridiales bacterium]|jgi:hypothetical protein|nr:ATP-binding protein [Clostridiales bacterium]
MNGTPLPIGVEDFKDIIRHNQYYVDKTLLIRDLLDNRGAVTLITRPRRFGKTLNMSMLRYFFEDTHSERLNEENKLLFYGNEHYAEKKIIMEGNDYVSHMCGYPVVFITLKSAKQGNWENAFLMLKKAICKVFRDNRSVIDKLGLSSMKKRFSLIMEEAAYDSEYYDSLRFLSEALYEVYQKKTIILIDEYDVPLENSYERGFYEKMTDFIRSLFESALKTNPCLEFAVLTGCLRVSKESVFTGLNNFDAASVLSTEYSEYFGFTEPEVCDTLDFYNLSERFNTVKLWYDGYRMGNTEIYNPWSIINYIKSVRSDQKALPKPYWSNTSSNIIVYRLIKLSGLKERTQIENLIDGGTIEIPVHEEVTYADIDRDMNNLWNFLYFTGYLRQLSLRLDGGTIYIKAAIPNEEVRYIYRNSIMNQFREDIEGRDLSGLYKAMLANDARGMEQAINRALLSTISFHDSAESFYHGFMAGIFQGMTDYIVESNREEGNGRPDMIIRYPNFLGKAFILEFKASNRAMDLESCLQSAADQIVNRNYAAGLISEGYTDITCFGIAFYRKNCLVKQV